MEDLNEEVIGAVLLFLDDADDLLRLSRTCRFFHSLVKGPIAQAAWQHLCLSAAFPPPPAPAEPAAPGPSHRPYSTNWAAHFKICFLAEAAQRRLRRRLQLQQLDSKLQAAERDISRLQEGLRHESDRLAGARGEMAAIKRAGEAERASTLWAPQAVQRHFDRVIQQAPVDATWRLTSLEQEVRAGEAQQQVLGKQLTARRREAHTLRRRIQAMGG